MVLAIGIGMAPQHWTTRVADYYRSQAVRARMAEFCGGRRDDLNAFTAYGFAAFGGVARRCEADGAPVPFPVAELPSLLDEGADICRTLADRQGTLLALDVDYGNPTEPGEPYANPLRTFRRIEPVHRQIREVFGAHGIQPLIVATGRGYHYVIRAPFGSAFQQALVAMGTPSVPGKRGVPATIDPSHALEMERAHEGAGRLLEHLAHRVAHGLRGHTEVPVTLADVRPSGGGPFICLDLSAYGDPLFTRYLRCAFSANQKTGLWGHHSACPFVLTVTRGDESLETLIQSRTDPVAAERWSVATRAEIPDVSEAKTLLEDYRSSALARFHRSFDGETEALPPSWPTRDGDFAPANLPACLAVPFEQPNPLLLQPAYLRTIALGLWGLGASPKAIAGIVAREYGRDHGWRPTFTHYDSARRAGFYTRVLCGAFADGLDTPDQFTCESQRGRGLCAPARCSDQSRRLFSTLAGLAQRRIVR
jgi:hypothetical protein